MYFFNLFYMLMWYIVTVPTLEFDYLYIYYINYLFSPVTVSFYFSSMAKLRFVNFCTNKRMLTPERPYARMHVHTHAHTDGPVENIMPPPFSCGPVEASQHSRP